MSCSHFFRNGAGETKEKAVRRTSSDLQTLL